MIDMLTTILWFIVVGAVIGALARLLVPGRNPIGVLLTILVGVVGAILGGVIANALGAGTLIALVFAIVIAAVGVAALTSTNGANGRRGGRRWHGGGRWHGGRTRRGIF